MKHFASSALPGLQPRPVCFALALTAMIAAIGAAAVWGDSRVVVVPSPDPPPPPLVFAAAVETVLDASPGGVAQESVVTVRVLQGRPERVVLGLEGRGEVEAVEAEWLAGWAVRSESEPDGERRYLEILPRLPEEEAAPPERLEFTMRAGVKIDALPAEVRPLLPGPGAGAGFSQRVVLRAAAAVSVDVLESPGFQAAAGEGRDQVFLSGGEGSMVLRLAAADGRQAAEMSNAHLVARWHEAENVVRVRATADVRVRESDAELPLLRGGAALAAPPRLAGAGGGPANRFEVTNDTDDDAAADTAGLATQMVAARLLPGRDPVTALVFGEPGVYPVELEFDVPVEELGAARKIDFEWLAGSIVPVRFEGFGGDAVFGGEGDSLVPRVEGGAALAFLPSGGSCRLTWTPGRLPAGEAELFMNAEMAVTAVAGPGLLTQETRANLRILQGETADLVFELDGPGEILGVEGGEVADWRVEENGENGEEGERLLLIRLIAPQRGEIPLVILSQTALGETPAQTVALRVIPAGQQVRSSGHLRVSGRGAVRVEVVEAEGLMQIPPEQWPGDREGTADLRQATVYRFPTPEYSLGIHVDQIVPEVSVEQVLVYEMGDTDRVIEARLELDIREAPLREWDMLVPEGYALVAAEGADVADAVPGGAAGNGLRRMKLVFEEAVEGRRLARLRLERNEPASASTWELPIISHPAARSVRGYLGVAAAAGFRLDPADLAGLTESPLALFPGSASGLQHAFRLRGDEWAASFEVSELARNVQADLFHLYTLREGGAAAAVLVNFFTVGSPVGEWRFSLPESARNLAVEGHDVRAWHQEEDVLVVAMERPSTGAATLLITFEEALARSGGRFSPGGLRPLDVDGERGYIQVASPYQVRLDVVEAGAGVAELEASELPPEFALLALSPSLAVFQYPDRPAELTLEAQWFDPAETSPQLVDFARMTSRLAWDGQVAHEARWFVKSRGREVLRLRLPDGADLWEVQADGARVNPRDDAGQTIIPLPPARDALTPVEVILRYGQPQRGRRSQEFAAPVADVPVMMSEWKIEADRGRHLVWRGGNARPVDGGGSSSTAMEVLLSSGAWVTALLIAGLVAVALALHRRREPWGWWVAAVLLLVALGLAVTTASWATETGEASVRSELRLEAPVIPAAGDMRVVVGHLPEWRAGWSPFGLLVVALGAVMAVAGAAGLGGRRMSVLACGGGLVLCSLGLLSQGAGLAWFFLLLAAAGLVAAGVLARGFPRRVPKAAASGALLILMPLVWLACPPDVRGETREVAALETVTQTWGISGEAVRARAEVTALARRGEVLPLLAGQVALTSFEGDGLREVPAGSGVAPGFRALATRDGRVSAVFEYEIRISEETRRIALPTPPAAVQVLDLALAREGWEAVAEPAVRRTVTADGRERFVLPPRAVEVVLQPRARDVGDGEARFFVETTELFLPAPGIVNGRHMIAVRPARGSVARLEVVVPEGFTVGDVEVKNLAQWRFDPRSRLLTLDLAPALADAFPVFVATQRASGSLPYPVDLAPLRVNGAAGQVGMLATAFGGDAVPDRVEPQAMTPVDNADVSRSLVERVRAELPGFTPHQAYRHSGEAASGLSLDVLAVEPEVRVTSSQILSLGEERVVLAADLAVDISRAGIFRLSFDLPPGLEIESATGEALTHWTEAATGDGADAARRVTLNLAGSTLGSQRFSLVLAGPFPAQRERWSVPGIVVREAPRQTGVLTLVPERGTRLRITGRENVVETAPPDTHAARPGVLSFRLLQPDWSLESAIDMREAWTTVEALQEISAREGMSRTRLALRLSVEHAAIRAFRLRLPGLGEEDAASLRADGEAVADIVRVGEPEEGLWEVRFKRGILGQTAFDLHYQQRRRMAGVEDGNEIGALELEPVDLVDARQTTFFVAARTGGRLELSAEDLPGGWQSADWQSLPPALVDPTQPDPPALMFRALEPEAPLALRLRRQDMAGTLPLSIASARLHTVVSGDGAAATHARFHVSLAEKTTLRLTLPEQAELLALTVDGRPTALAREEGSLHFYLMPGAAADQPVAVDLAYTTAARRGGRALLAAPAIHAPVEDVEWRVTLPGGRRLAAHRGSLVLAEEAIAQPAAAGAMETYLARVAARRAEEETQGNRVLAEGNRLLAEGQSDKALGAFKLAVANVALDEASNEDARVQLRNIQTQQAVIGLNTRRQVMALDQGAAAPAEARAQAEQAARDNPLLQNRSAATRSTQVDTRRLGDLMQGSTLEEAGALRRIAERILVQQEGAATARSSLTPILPEEGTTLLFSRSVQADADSPLELDLRLTETRPRAFLPSLAFFTALAAAFLLTALLARASNKRQG